MACTVPPPAIESSPTIGDTPDAKVPHCAQLRRKPYRYGRSEGSWLSPGSTTGRKKFRSTSAEPRSDPHHQPWYPVAAECCPDMGNRLRERTTGLALRQPAGSQRDPRVPRSGQRDAVEQARTAAVGGWLGELPDKDSVVGFDDALRRHIV
jgi:hypothetical protein